MKAAEQAITSDGSTDKDGKSSANSGTIKEVKLVTTLPHGTTNEVESLQWHENMVRNTAPL
jgi:hypothetical protein